MFNKIFARPFIGGDSQSYERRIRELESEVDTQTATRNMSKAYTLAKELEEVKRSADATYFSGRKNNDD